MISLRIRYLPPLTGITSKSQEKMEVESVITLTEILKRLSHIYGEKFKAQTIARNNPYLLIMVNGKALSEAEMNIELKDGDSIIMGVPVGGG